MHTRTLLVGLLLVLAAMSVPAGAATTQGPASDGSDHDHAGHGHGAVSALHAELDARFLADQQEPMDLDPAASVPCEDGFAGEYPCRNVDLMAFLPLAEIGGGSGNDVWGWTDPDTGREYALMGRSSGTAFVDVTDPADPLYVGNLPTHTSNSSWRDIKVVNDHAFIGSEASGHGLQVFDLSRLRDISPSDAPVTLDETAHYGGFGNSHNIVANDETGLVVAVGSNTCSGGLHLIDATVPSSPLPAGCYAGDGYTHDAQCVVYRGPDEEHAGRELCFALNEDTLTIVDVTDRSAPVQISRTPYSGARYTHQGWLSEDHVWMGVNDELDETGYGHTTRTRYFDLTNLEEPLMRYASTNGVSSIDHNMYVKDGVVYQANYRSGLRIYPLHGTEVGFFDIYPADDNPSFNGAWSTYPFFDSGTVLISGIEQGLFVVRPRLPNDLTPGGGPTTVDELAAGASDARIDVTGAASFAEPPMLVGQDSASDARPPGVGAEIATATAASTHADGTIRFTLSVRDQTDGTGGTLPETVRYLWGAQFGDESRILEATVRADGAAFTPRFRLLDGDETEIASLQGTMEDGIVRIDVPLETLGAATGDVLRAGATYGLGTYASPAGLATITQAPLDTIAVVDPYVVPGPTVRVGIAPAGTPPHAVDAAVPATVASDGSFEATLDASGLDAGSYTVAVRACYGPAVCDTETVEITL